MKTMTLKRCAAITMAVLASGCCGAEEGKSDASKTPPAGNTKSAADDAKSTAKVAETDPYKVPENADSKTLIAFSMNLFAQRAKIHTRPELEEYNRKLRAPLKTAQELILKNEKSESTEAARFALRNLLGLGIDPALRGDEGDLTVFLKRVAAFINAQEPVKEDVGLVMGLQHVFEPKHPDTVKDFYNAVIPALQKSKTPEIQRYAEVLRGTVRRLNLVGHEMELKGTTLDGKPFDVASLRGKVVLVDFWATWCTYCIQEMPNIKQNYAAYHNKGFEVVSVSGDKQKSDVLEYLKKDNLPWIQLYDNEGTNLAVMQYAITSLPRSFLIGRDGRVVALSARAHELPELLKKELGEPEPMAAEAPAKTPEATPKAPAPTK